MDYTERFVTNHFHVTDERKWEELMERVHTDHKETHKDGTHSLAGEYFDFDIPEDSGETVPSDQPFDDFMNEAKGLIPEDEALVLQHVGYEGLKYVGGFVLVAHRGKVRSNGLQRMAVLLLAEIEGVDPSRVSIEI